MTNGLFGAALGISTCIPTLMVCGSLASSVKQPAQIYYDNLYAGSSLRFYIYFYLLLLFTVVLLFVLSFSMGFFIIIKPFILLCISCNKTVA